MEAGTSLMLARGFVAASVEDICAAAGVSKGSFFHHFEGKEALALEVLTRFSEARFRDMRAAVAEIADPLARVRRMLAVMSERAPEAVAGGGCLLGAFAQELAQTHPALRAACEERFETWAGALAEDLSAAQRAHPVRREFDPRGVADCLIAVFEGALLIAKARRDPAVVRESLAHFERYLTSLFA